MDEVVSFLKERRGFYIVRRTERHLDSYLLLCGETESGSVVYFDADPQFDKHLEDEEDEREKKQEADELEDESGAAKLLSAP